MTRRTLFILIGTGILVLAAIVLLLIGKFGKNNNIQNANQAPVSNPATLPTETVNNQQNIQSVENDIKNATQEPSSQQAIKDGVASIDFKDQNGKVIPLADFESATGTSINKQLGGYLDNTDYHMYYCPADSNGKSYAIYFGYNVSKAYVNLFPDTVAWMKEWEKTMLPDLHAALFPDVNFSAEELNQSLQFKDGKYRYTEVQLPGEKTSSINYHVSDNGVIISASPSCMDKLVNIYEPVEP